MYSPFEPTKFVFLSNILSSLSFLDTNIHYYFFHNTTFLTIIYSFIAIIFVFTLTNFKSTTIDIFNTCYFCQEGNRRGLGFDKPELDNSGNLKYKYVSKSSFGHTGFTGTMAWADPETDIVFVFLSNRTYPDSNAPNKLLKERIRESIQQIIHDAIEK